VARSELFSSLGLLLLRGLGLALLPPFPFFPFFSFPLLRLIYDPSRPYRTLLPISRHFATSKPSNPRQARQGPLPHPSTATSLQLVALVQTPPEVAAFFAANARVRGRAKSTGFPYYPAVKIIPPAEANAVGETSVRFQ
jgi:hypothetical protein